MTKHLGGSLFAVLTLSLLANTRGLAQSLPPLTRHTWAVTQNGAAKSIGRLPAKQVMNLVLVLPLRDQTGLNSFLDDIHDPSSPNFHRYLSVDEFTQRFGPAQSDYDTVVSFAKANNLHVIGGSRDQMLVRVQAPVSAVEAAFHVQMNAYQHPTENRAFYAPDREPTADLPFALWHIGGLDNYSTPRPQVSRAATLTSTGFPADFAPAGMSGSGPSGGFLGSDMRAAYYGNGPLTGAGQNLGLFEWAPVNLADVNLYFSKVGQTNHVPITLLSVDGTSPACTTSCGSIANGEAESVLDQTQAISMAPGLASLTVFTAAPTPGSTDVLIMSAMTTHNPLPTTISISWTWGTADASSLDPYFKRMQAQGQTMLAAAGDYKSWTSSGSVYPSDDAYIISVGGTELSTNGAGGAWQSETAWVAGSYGSGGGVSPHGIPIPLYQQVPNVISSANGGSITLRNGPDVSANANNFYVCAMSSCASGWLGTSFAAPMWAGYLALANQQAVANGIGDVGFINTAIYYENVNSIYSTDFHDITTSPAGNDYPVVAGYDLITGWGSPNGAGLINTLTNMPAPSPTGYFAAINFSSGLCLDNTAGSHANGNKMQQYTCITGDPNQNWVFTPLGSGYYSIKNQSSQLCLDNGGSVSAGSQIQQYSCTSADTNQEWKLVPLGGRYYIENLTSGMCIDDTGGSHNPGNLMQQFTCGNNNPNQLWTLQPH